ncbi:MAG TPA: type I 3-dehydroquinate dehydratase [Thermoplasmata archaeon]|nr:type I 3-dehydroquinate dehydratase [Thermoplasmata archaeon]
MSRPAPLVIVSLPGRSVEELRDEVRAAEAGRADLAEIRLDRLSPEQLPRLGELFPSPVPLLATYRSAAEGGQGASDPELRRAILSQAAELPFAWIDLEAARDRSLYETMRAGPGRTVVLSTHFPELSDLAPLAQAAREPVPPHGVRKLVAPAAVSRWLFEIVPNLPPPGESPLVVAATGPAGPLSRAESRRLGAAAVFAALPRAGPGEGLRDAVEPSQIPVDRLRRFLEATDEAPLFGIAGRPVAHSRSPDLHGRWMARDGRSGLYVPLEFGRDEEFVRCLPGLAAAGFRGINVTHPFKPIALGAASRVERAAEVCGVANCLTFEGDEVEAQNTDLAAILRRLTELQRARRWAGGDLAVIGNGGAARATLAAARELSVPARLYARRAGAAGEIARAFGATVGDPDHASHASLVVHATPVGRLGAGVLEVPIHSLVGPGTIVLDWVYAPDDPAVRVATEAGGGTYEDGWRLLVYQAAESYAIWWGEPPAASEVDRAVAEGP